jgi:hypothetical protein
VTWWHEAPDLYARLSAYAAELALFYAFAGLPERSAPYWPILDRVASTREQTPQRSFHDPPDPETVAFMGPEYKRYEDDRIEAEAKLLSFVMSVGAAAALHSGDVARMDRYARHGEVHSARVVTQLHRMLDLQSAWEEPAEDGHWHDRQEVFRAGLTGDAGEVAAVLARQRSTGRSTLPRVLPRLSRNRDRLDEWFREEFPRPCLTCGSSSLLGHLSDRREVARLLGADKEREGLQAIAVRFVDALTDPAIAFELDELETFFARPR